MEKGRLVLHPGRLFAQEPIEIVISTIHASSVKLGLTADSRLRILRDELCAERYVYAGA